MVRPGALLHPEKKQMGKAPTRTNERERECFRGNFVLLHAVRMLGSWKQSQPLIMAASNKAPLPSFSFLLLLPFFLMD